MNLRVGIAAIAALTVACKKSPEVGTASGSAVVSGGSGSPAVPDAAGPGAAASDSDSRGSAAGSASAGSATPGSAAGSAAGSGTADRDGAATYNKAAFLADPLCMQVADKIRECAARPEFVAALDDGASVQQKRINARLRNGVKKWQSSFELCHNAWDILNYEFTGFLDQPAVFKVPSALSSCADLGAAVKAGGGLVGGNTAE